MPYTNNWEKEGLYRQFTGNIGGDEILESNFELHTSPNFETIKYIINDFRGITGHSINSTHTKIYALTDNIISNTKGELSIALIVTQAPLLVLAELYREQMTGKLFTCEIFQNVEDARKWIVNK